MPKLQVFDRINRIDSEGKAIYKLRSMPYEDYFGEMDFLTEEEQKERISLAKDLEDAMMFLFFMVISESQYAYMAAISSAEVKGTFRQRIIDIVSRHTEISNEMLSQINQFVDDATDTTYEHLIILSALMDRSTAEIDSDKQESEEYYLSDDRARLLAEEESNSLFNYKDFGMALSLGYSTKTWVTMNDGRVRRTHIPLHEKTIPTDELFQVGDSFMRFPRDAEIGASMKEISKCRCGVKYNM